MVNSGIWVPNSQSVEVGSLIVIGAGITSVRDFEGRSYLSEQSTDNAATAADLMLKNAGVRMAFVTGDHPNTGLLYDSTEKDLMTDAMVVNGVGQERIWKDPAPSYTTYGNMRYAGKFVEEFRDEPIGIVGNAVHTKRAARFGRKFYGRRTDFMPIPTPGSKVSATQVALNAFWQVWLVGANRLETMDRRHDAAEVLFSRIKRHHQQYNH